MLPFCAARRSGRAKSRWCWFRKSEQPGQEDIIVTDPKPADKPQAWKMTQTISVAALVYGPAGLNRKKVAKFLSQDEVLIAQLADYADKTAQAEQLVATLSNSESSSASVNAALSGFASQYGFAVQIDRNAPVAAQAATVFAAMNPQLAAYNPLASSTAQSAGQTASLATMAGTLFFGSPIGLAAGGTAMLLDLRSIAFPDTQFRASFAQPLAGSPASISAASRALCRRTRELPTSGPAASRTSPRRRSGSARRISSPHAEDAASGGRAGARMEISGSRAAMGVGRATRKKLPVPVVKLGNQRCP